MQLFSENVGKREIQHFLVYQEQAKQQLSTDPDRYLIGDDEHGWDENGVFNIEGAVTQKSLIYPRRQNRIYMKLQESLALY